MVIYCILLNLGGNSMTFRDDLGSFATGWMFADILGLGKNGKGKNNRNGKVFHVGRKLGNKPKEAAISEIAGQLQDGDTVILDSDIVDNVTINAIIEIEGQGHTLFVESGNGGLNLHTHCRISNLNFVMNENANGIFVRQPNCELYLEDCTFEHQSPNNASPSIYIAFPLSQMLVDSVKIDKATLNTRKLIGTALSLGVPEFLGNNIGVKENGVWTRTDVELEELNIVNTAVGINGTIGYLKSLMGELSTLGGHTTIENFGMDLQLDSKNILKQKVLTGLNIYGNVTINQVTTPEVSQEELERYSKAAKLFNISPKNNESNINISGEWTIPTHWGNQIKSGQVHFENYKDVNTWYIKDEKANVSWKDSNFKYKNDFIATPKPKTAQEKLDEMIGLDEVKKKVKIYIATNVANKKRKEQGQPVADNSLHLIFGGAAGTGKTQVARLLAEILFENGIISKASPKEATAKDMLGEFTGQTSPKTHNLIMEAKGGVLFIDEAYELDPSNGGSDGYKKEALTTLVKDMDDFRSDLIVIMAGYTEEMEKLLQANSGLPSRFLNKINFPDYSKNELVEIAYLQLNQQYQKLDDEARQELEAFIHKAKQNNQVNGNGRWIRNLLQFVSQARDVRVVSDGTMDTNPEALNLITVADVREGLENF